ncbi:uncharacterized protein OCT59_021487 [Rhizophagus irregularis]|uniref:uncharacterized protein n=1 Tax=Rhizophagus irregularis TaxID=588596 RepID=UPI00331CC499|nr:hypothetical protein OCT59_021487 [Rhizophagus irregularis]
MEPSIPLLKFVKIRYIEGKLIIDYDNPLQTPIGLYLCSVVSRFRSKDICKIFTQLSFVHHLSNITGAYAQMLQQILKEQVNNISLFLI